MNRLYLSIIIIILSCGSQLYAMQALTRSFAGMNVSSARVLSQVGKRALHASAHTGGHRAPIQQALVPVRDQKKALVVYNPAVIDVPFNVLELKIETQSCTESNDYHFDMIVKNGLSYEGEVKAFLMYIQYLHNKDQKIYANYMKRVYTLVATRLSGQEYVNPMLLAAVILSEKSVFKNIMHIISGNISRITGENVFASYKVLEMLLRVTPNATISHLSFKDWDCKMPHKQEPELVSMFDTYFKVIPNNLDLSHRSILLKLMYGATLLLKGLQEKGHLRTYEIEKIKKDFKRYEKHHDILVALKN